MLLGQILQGAPDDRALRRRRRSGRRALAARLLGWRPADFWDATPAELAASLADRHDTAAAPLSRAELDT